ncbi:MAG: hypothetical protein Q3982_08155 [Phoenicibacter congonensis]|uniref:Uncharacterized protein n=1 Tax=Phoenicibacter congonensis TaxID=1944646 RepID=A0AA43RJK5_9ACTN|nr:hypothetical protein [Phoenicibacter congonensis]
MEQFITLFGNYKDKEHPRFWASVSNKGYKDGKETDDYIKANINVNLTKAALEFFDANCKATKNEDIDMCMCKLKSGWLKAVQGKEESYVVLVCHELALPEKKEEKKERRR